jgi:hypothetical protein
VQIPPSCMQSGNYEGLGFQVRRKNIYKISNALLRP